MVRGYFGRRCKRCSPAEPKRIADPLTVLTALLLAAHRNELQTATLLIRSGADPNTANDHSHSHESQPRIRQY